MKSWKPFLFGQLFIICVMFAMGVDAPSEFGELDDPNSDIYNKYVRLDGDNLNLIPEGDTWNLTRLRRVTVSQLVGTEVIATSEMASPIYWFNILQTTDQIDALKTDDRYSIGLVGAQNATQVVLHWVEPGGIRRMWSIASATATQARAATERLTIIADSTAGGLREITVPN